MKRVAAFILSLILCLGLCACTQKDPEPPEDPPKEEPKQSISTYGFLEGTSEENEIIVISSENEGPCVFIVGGIHGDEVAGYTAAHELKEELKIGCGTVYILEPLNQSGAAANKRKVTGSGDINRSFPGNADSADMAEKIAGTLYAELDRIQPDLVLDLHEAQVELGQGTSNAGMANTLIFTAEDQLSDLLFEFVIKNEKGEVAHRKYGLTSPGVAQSFNRVVSEELGIPVITVETWRKLELEERVAEQKEIVGFCLDYLGMLNGSQPK